MATTAAEITSSLTPSTTTTIIPEFTFFVSDWSPCSSECFVGVNTREVYCSYTCSRYRCPSAPEARCDQIARPAEQLVCYGASYPCPETTAVSTTVTPSAAATSVALTTSTALAATTQRLDDPPSELWECLVSNFTGCLPTMFAELRCKAGCSCCREKLIKRTTTSTTKFSYPALPSGSANTLGALTSSASGSDGSSDMGIVIGVVVGCVFLGVVLTLLVMWWRSCVRSATKAKKNAQARIEKAFTQEAQAMEEATRDQPPPGPSPSKSTQDRPGRTTPQAWTYFDRNLGEGVPSAPPPGYDEEDAKWDKEHGNEEDDNPFFGRDARATPKNKDAWAMPQAPSASPTARDSRSRRKQGSTPSSADRQEPEVEPAASPKQERQATGPLPPGSASASRAGRRAGKEAFIPGQINTDHDERPAASGPAASPPRGTAVPPRAKEDPFHDFFRKSKTAPSSKAGKRTASESPRRKETPPSAGGEGRQGAASGGSSGTGTGTGTGGGNSSSQNNSAVASVSAASPQAEHLIAQADKELDQSQGKDMEVRRGIFKNLMLKWHPDKNQSEPLAAEVFRHLMARRGRYLEA
ncbi:unnamed protein product [Polarella glacialis]|uniref:J domain-containing protein n=1 Tax=Polarella glacialis TaxID=89957 RepID=A0A813JUY1_POLGL|nr:unnamed protein product [Polarella glacialis]